MSEIIVDLVIAVHTPERDIVRAVASVLNGNEIAIRVTVVCHNTPAAGIADRLGAWATDNRVRLIELNDGIRSPAGPFNAGLDAATADYSSVMGSDDELEPGAIDSWVRLARRTRADAVLARVRHAGGPALPSPPTRPLRSRQLDSVKDRLSYRSAPLGLVSRKRFADVRFTTGVRTGEDIGYVTEVWFSAGSLAYDRNGPAYLIHADGAERVTTLAPPIASDLEFFAPLLRSEAYLALSDAQRSSLLLKLTRGSVFSLVQNRPDPGQWPDSERAELAEVVSVLRQELRSTRLGERAFSRADLRLLDVMQSPTTPVDEVLELSRRRRAFTTAPALLTRRITDVFRADAPLRFAVATVLARW